MSRIRQVIDALEAERADVRERLDWLEQQINEFRAREDGVTVPARSNRRATARRASRRRHTARNLQPDLKGQIIAYLEKHPESTAGDVSKGLSLNRNTTATRLSQLAKAGEIRKAQRGYSPR